MPADLDLWGSVSIVKGDYPYINNYKESRVLIDTNSSVFGYSTDIFNYIVSIINLELNGSIIYIQRVSVFYIKL